MGNKGKVVRTRDIKENDVVITVHGEAAEKIAEELQLALNKIRRKHQLGLSYCIYIRRLFKPV